MNSAKFYTYFIFLSRSRIYILITASNLFTYLSIIVWHFDTTYKTYRLNY